MFRVRGTAFCDGAAPERFFSSLLLPVLHPVGVLVCAVLLLGGEKRDESRFYRSYSMINASIIFINCLEGRRR